ncbi:MAG: hypothetical protein K2X93_11210 [Candidatus Obscuribacterales bacterium]|nr:hypothetical protein [Candidatus Obscuribacterales bacterium]
MFDSIGRGFRLIMASIRMGWHDKRLLAPSIVTVISNIFFAILLYLQAKTSFGGKSEVASQFMAQGKNLLNGAGGPHGLAGGAQGFAGLTGLNGPMDPTGLGGSSDNVMAVTGILCVWWLTNRFLEGVTTALVYSHLTEGRGSGRFGAAASAVFTSLPAIIMLGLVTLIAKRIAGWLRGKRDAGGLFGFGFSFLAGIIEVFWTLAGHMILPAIVIEGTSFWGALKRADRIAQGNLLTIGVGEVGVDVICKITSGIVYGIGLGGFGLAYFAQMSLASPMMVITGLAWASLVLVVTALSIYIRSAFYTCLYVWAITAEEVEEAMRAEIAPPAPLAAALAR